MAATYSMTPQQNLDFYANRLTQLPTAENQAINAANQAQTNALWTPQAVAAKQASYSPDYQTRRAAEAYLVNNIGPTYNMVPMGTDAWNAYQSGFQPGQNSYSGDTSWLKGLGYTGYEGPSVSYWKNPQVVNPPGGGSGGGSYAGGGIGGWSGSGGDAVGLYNSKNPLYAGLNSPFMIPPSTWPDLGINAPGSSFNLFPGLQDAINQGLSATPNQAIWGPVQDELTRRMTQQFNESTLPMVRSEAQAAGQLGGPRNALQLGQMADQFTQNLGNQQSLLSAQAAQSAQDQRNVAAGLGLDVSKLQDSSRLADVTALLDQARLVEAARQANMQSTLTDLARREGARATDVGAGVTMRGQDLTSALGWGNIDLNRDIAGSNQALSLLGLQQDSQLAAMQYLPQLLQAMGYPASTLSQLGSAERGTQQQYLQDLQRIYGGSVQGPLGALQSYSQGIGNPYGGTQSYQYQPSTLQNAVAGGLTGYGLYNQYYQQPQSQSYNQYFGL